MYRAGIGAGCAVLIAVLAAAFPPVMFGQANTDDLANASIESLMNTTVTSVSRRQEELRTTAAAVFVITSDDIRRSGVSDIADLFRMVPGMNVAQSSSSVWAVSARGFNAQYSTKLLVTVDGRSVYDPSFSGVNWNLQNLVLEDIDRIEVIRGPGATMWGSNAVNGVISITTKKASDTQGGLFVANFGQGRPGDGTFRFGQAIGKNVFYRVSARQTTRSDFQAKSGDNGADAWNSTDMDSRVDWNPSTRDSYTFEFAGYRGVAGSGQSVIQTLSPLTVGPAGLLGTTGGHALGRWSRSLSLSSNLTIQFYFDDNSHKGFGAKDTRTVDFDLQNNFRFGNRQNIMWGIGHRENLIQADDTPSFGVDPSREIVNLSSAFVQDEITAVGGTVVLTVGSKFEKSSFTGYNVQPSLHVLWLPTSRQSVWVATSRAIRTANLVERGMHVILGGFNAGFAPGIVELFGQENATSEALMAYEAGYRYQPGRKIWIDLSTFYNVYQNLSTIAPGANYLTAAPDPVQLVVPLYFGNAMKGETYGAELSVNYRISRILTLRGGYSLLRMQLHADPGTYTTVENLEGQSPRHQLSAGAMLNLPKSFEASSRVYFVSSLSNFQVPAYTQIDSNITWKGIERLELSLIGQNLLGSHLEFGDTPAVSNLVSRSIFGRGTWKF